MIYVKTDGNNGVITYPYTLHELKREHPNVSFPKTPSPDVLSQYNVYPVQLADRPTYDITTHTIEKNSTPEYTENGWVLNWSIAELTQEETDKIINRYKNQVTAEADRRVNAITGDSTQKLTNLMIAVDILDKRDQRPLTQDEENVMISLRHVKAQVVAIRTAEATIKALIDNMTGPELLVLDIPNHPQWSQ